MTTKFVNSGAAGANDGTSWTDAWTALSSATGVAAGDEVRIHKTHSFTGAFALTFTNGTAANPVKLFCVDKDASDVLATGASFTCNSGAMALTGHLIVDGLTFTQSASSAFQFSAGANNIQRLFNCTVTAGAVANAALNVTGAGAVAVFVNCTLDLSALTASTQGIAPTGNGAGLVMRGGTIKGRSGTATTTLFPVAAAGAYVFLEEVDIQNTITNIATASVGGIQIVLKRCKLPTYTNLLSGTPSAPETGCRILVESCVGGTITAPALGLTGLSNRVGTVQSDLARYRTGGADDGAQANAHCWSMASNANALDGVSWLESPPISRWVAAGSYTVTVYVASGVTLEDDECWIEVLSPSEAGSATSQDRYQSTRLADRGTPAALTTDGGSTWNGSGVGTKQKMSVSIAPTLAGPVIARVCLAKTSTTVYLDPRLDVA